MPTITSCGILHNPLTHIKVTSGAPRIYTRVYVHLGLSINAVRVYDRPPASRLETDIVGGIAATINQSKDNLIKY